MSGLILAGDIYFDRLSPAGLSTGRIHLGNCTNFAVTEPTELKERISRQRASFGNALDSVYIKQPSQFEMTLDDFDRRTLAIALLGDTVDVTQDAGSATDEDVVARLGAWVKLAFEQVSSVVVEPDGGGVALVAGTDYEVNERLGMIRFLEGGAATEGTAYDVDYSYAAVEKQRIRGGILPSVAGEVFLDGLNLVNQQAVHFTAPKITMAPNGAVSLLNAGGDFGEFQASGRLNLKSGETAPYYLDLVA